MPLGDALMLVKVRMGGVDDGVKCGIAVVRVLLTVKVVRLGVDSDGVKCNHAGSMLQWQR